MKLIKHLVFIAIIFAVLFTGCEKDPQETDTTAITSVSIVGGATPLGWGIPGNPPLFTPMTKIDNNTFEITIMLSSSLLMFSCDVKPSWEGRWFLPPDSGELDLNVDIIEGQQMEMVLNYGDGGEAGPRWRIPKPAEYKVILDIEAKTVVFTEVGEYKSGGTDIVFNKMWLIDCKELPLPVEMNKIGDNWTITIPLMNNDHVKFNGEDEPISLWTDSVDRWFCPLADGIPAIDTLPVLFGIDNTFAFKIVTSGTYTITLNPKEGTVLFYSDNLNLSKTLWFVNTKPIISTADSWQMTETALDSGIYEWTGVISGHYKFCAFDTSPLKYTDGIWLGPEVDNKAPVGSAEIATMGSAFAWRIPYGLYTITLNTITQRVTFTKDGEPSFDDIDDLWVIGVELMPPWEAGTDIEWDAPNNTARLMTKNGNVFTWSYNFNESRRHFRIMWRENGMIFYPHPSALAPSSTNVLMNPDTDYEILTYDQAKKFLEDASRPGSVGSIPMFSWRAGTGIQTITVDFDEMKISYSAGGTPVDPSTGGDGGQGMPPGPATTFRGPAINNGVWGAYIPLTQGSPNIYTWQGNLQNGQLQFQQGGINIGTASATTVPVTGGTYSVARNNNTTFTMIAGAYAISLNMITNQLTFTPQ